MDSPLNLGHQQGRQADRMMKAEKYEEAILCHRRAAEYMLEAMQLSTSPYALESLNIQHKHHIRQQELIQARLNRIEAKEAANLKSPKAVHKPSVPVVAADAYSRETTPSSDKEQSSERSTVTPILTQNEELIYRTMSENDSLLCFLVNRTTSAKPPLNNKPVEPNYKVIPKHDKEIIEELRIHTEDLRKHILLLLKEFEECRLENQELHERLRQYESAEALYLDTDNIHLPSLELPPLEMPKFDFDSITDKFSDSESDNHDTNVQTGK